MVQTRWLAATMVVALVIAQPVRADDKGDAAAKEAADAFVKSFKARDAEGLMKVLDVPFCDDGKKIYTDRDELKKKIEKEIQAGPDLSKDAVKVTVFATLEKAEQAVGKQLLKEEDRRAKMVEVLGKEHRVAVLEIEKDGNKMTAALAIRLKDGKAKVVGFMD